MLRWPYNWRKPEGIRYSKFDYFWNKLDSFVENLFIFMTPFPKKGIYNGEQRKETVTLSLTTYPGRIKQVFYAIKSLMIQSYKADKIILWLAESQFPNKKLPQNIYDLEKKGLTIRWCDDLRSHKKYFYALQEQKTNELIITFDDDIIYEYNAIEKLITYHQKFPNTIICNRACEITINNNGEIMPYLKWNYNNNYGTCEPVNRLLISSGAGCLFPYNIMPKETFYWNIIIDNALSADDIWLSFCCLFNNIKIIKTQKIIATLVNVYGSQKDCLTKINDIQGENQNVIDRLLKYFNK